MIVLLALLLDTIFSYYGINSLFIFSSLVIIKKDYYFNIFLIGVTLELLYINDYYLVFILISSFFIKGIFKIINENYYYKVILLYILTFIYNFLLMFKTNNYNYKYALITSFLPCTFYIIYLYINKRFKHKLKYENNKQIINSSYIYPMRTYRFKEK